MWHPHNLYCAHLKPYPTLLPTSSALQATRYWTRVVKTFYSCWLLCKHSPRLLPSHLFQATTEMCLLFFLLPSHSNFVLSVHLNPTKPSRPHKEALSPSSHLLHQTKPNQTSPHWLAEKKRKLGRDNFCFFKLSVIGKNISTWLKF
jgi:hypothetical protein